jgi:phosphogluconate dehydratase
VITAGADEQSAYVGMPELQGDELVWKPAMESTDVDVLRPATGPFLPDGGMRLVQGNLGRGIFKTSAVDSGRWTIEAPVLCFSDQQQVLDAFQKRELDRDCIVVVRFQGPRSNGMPELHKLTPALGVVQDRGFRVALVTDGRMSGASGKVPAAIHITPEALPDGPLARLRDGDVVRLCGHQGQIEALGANLDSREPAPAPPPPIGTGRELFAMLRHTSTKRRREDRRSWRQWMPSLSSSPLPTNPICASLRIPVIQRLIAFGLGSKGATHGLQFRPPGRCNGCRRAGARRRGQLGSVWSWSFRRY